MLALRDFDLFPVGHFFNTSRHRPWTRQFANEIGSTLQAVDRQFNEMERDLANVFGSVAGSTSLNPRIEPQIVQDGDKKKYMLNINMGKEFAPENLKMSIKDNVMTIDAKKEFVSEDGNHRSYQEVSRKFTLPEGIDAKAVTSHLDNQGVLKIEAPLPQKALPEPPKPTMIPIDCQ